MGVLAERVFDKRKFVLLNSYGTKAEARYFATQYKDGAAVGGTRLARVVKTGRRWELWVCPSGGKG